MPQAGNIFRLSESSFLEAPRADGTQLSPATQSVGLHRLVTMGVWDGKYRTPLVCEEMMVVDGYFVSLSL